ncbi:phospholipase b1, membrane-associated-like [Plakobranchus ocellatus]|uniref:Phospholipase b1, membrane-associated-like n=1 Tax=Plakobranchus ocellatus TaxID=259542 RepID=A0AAV4BXT3_9GAST|nr:phospholipase b1, membrane-associated-like [Plakobranchus ocellatus]
MKAGFDILYNNIPRAFVNSVVLLDVGLVQILRKGIISDLVLCFACSCATYPKTDEDAARLVQYRLAYQQGLQDLVDSGAYETDNFTVVNQLFFVNTTLPYVEGKDDVIDYSFFAIDRFHISQKGQAVAGLSLWNSMFEPVGNKSTSVQWTNGNILCPTEDSPYLFTHRNSNTTYYLPERKLLADYVKKD